MNNLGYIMLTYKIEPIKNWQLTSRDYAFQESLFRKLRLVDIKNGLKEEITYEKY